MGNITKDQMVVNLQQEVQKRKEEITKINSSTYITNQIFKETPNSVSINLNTITTVEEAISILAIIVTKSTFFYQTSDILGIKKSNFTHQGYTLDEWISDFRLKVSKIKMSDKKKKLAKLEAQLLELESPELKAQRTLNEIQTALQEED